MSEALLSVRELTKEFPLRKGLFAPRRWKRAVDDVSFEIERGRTLAKDAPMIPPPQGK